MAYVNCPDCGGKLCEGENGSVMKLKCAKCGKVVSVKIESGKVTVSTNEACETATA